MAKKDKQKTPEEIIELLAAAYSRWESHSRGKQCNYGCSDGAMMNMERKNIIRYHNELDELQLTSYPEIYNRKIPDEANRYLWVNMEQWDAAGKKLLQQYKENQDYQYLLSVVDKLNDRQKKQCCFQAVLGYVERFEYALNNWRDESDSAADLKWYVRRHVACPFYDAFDSCRRKIQNMGIDICSDTVSFTVSQDGQLSFIF
ncbi:MAG: hypothetical protein NC347_00325 [Clostridium sp.]|nr:hypothetical protein [Clostridium sp.]